MIPLNTPNLVTFSRIILIPLLIGIFYAPVSEQTQNVTATAVFIFAGITDWCGMGLLLAKAPWNQRRA